MARVLTGNIVAPGKGIILHPFMGSGSTIAGARANGLPAVAIEASPEYHDMARRAVPALALSGGERRRVEIARALASRPSFVLLDEPLAGIDPISLGEICDLISHLRDRKIGVLITDHNVREAFSVADRLYILHDGRVLMNGTPDEIASNPDVKQLYLGQTFRI